MLQDTIAAIATPAQPSAIGIIRVSGPETKSIIVKLFKIKIDNLEFDETLYAGGISLMKNKDFLNPHLDNSHDKDKKKYRRLNLLYYVTPDWKYENVLC